MSILQGLRVVSLDSSLLGDICRDQLSRDANLRATANAFTSDLLSNGIVPLLTLHHFEELLQHENLEVARSRFRFLHALPVLAWLAPASGGLGFGSIVDILCRESAFAFHNPEASCFEVRDAARLKMFSFGSGDDLLGGFSDGFWEQLRPIFHERAEQARHTVAISRAKTIDVSAEKASLFIAGPRRSPEETRRVLAWMNDALAQQIENRGDRRISEPSDVANDFLRGVLIEGNGFSDTSEEAAVALLKSWLIELDDISPETTMGEIMELSTFRKQLSLANETLGLPWEKLRKAIKPERLPSWRVINAIRRHGQDFPEWKGSDLTDSYLAVLVTYADFSFVDKRTSENLIRARRKDRDLEALVRHVGRGHYTSVVEQLLGSR